ncbi:MAG: N-acetylmuramic acid 6-phosphate etherase [Bacteroidia bacterium]|nr:N-acetylmuramic acid 6-phosphate etherase [Bacteroidia bacterium]NNC85143.1 N-acetylmuramic acid 6-phosphate etherase [Bacteroidia bacterium]
MSSRITEKSSNYDDLEKMEVGELIENINKEDKTVAVSVEKELPAITKLAQAVFEKLNSGGRLFYIGAGTSGRLGIVDASECPPTYGVEHDLVIGLIAGGDSAIRKAVEFAEDDPLGGWHDLQKENISEKDIVIGLAASGTTPYVVGALELCQKNNITTGCITCNPNAPISKVSDFPVEVVVGPEFVTGSTRMKSGTAQKLVLNMVSSAAMIKLGRVKGNKMVDMQLSNNKLVDRGVKMLMNELNISEEKAKEYLLNYGSVRSAISELKKK